MEVTYKTQGIILQREQYGENDSRVFVYTPNFGKLELVARGTQKLSSKLAAHLEPLNLCEIMVVRGKQYDYLGTAISEEVFAGIKDDYDKTTVAGEILKLVNEVTKEKQAEQAIFLLLKEFFSILNDVETRHGASLLEILFSAFTLKFLSLLGYAPQLERCVVCQKTIELDNNKFSFSHGGMVCKMCNAPDSVAISNEAVKIMRLALTPNWQDILKLTIPNELRTETGRLATQFKEYCLVDFLRQKR